MSTLADLKKATEVTIFLKRFVDYLQKPSNPLKFCDFKI